MSSQAVIFWLGFLVSMMSGESTLESEHRSKRIINGQPLRDNDIYKTTYFVELKNVWKCLTNQFDHKLDDCEQQHWCSGSLIHPQFVMTACHCISYLLFYSGEYWPTSTTPVPPIPKDPWSLHSVPYRSFSYPMHRAEEQLRTSVKGYHPLTNSMALFAGSTELAKMTQRRHAAAFFPHTHCRKRREEIYMGDTNIYPIEYDIGLIKTCYPFTLDKGITVAPIHPTTNLKPDLRDALAKNKVCLYAGWGEMLAPNEKVGGKKILPEILQHHWRHIDCSDECTFGIKCIICSQQQGKNLSHPTKGDSGSPVICDGKVIGVHNSGGAYYSDNLTYAMDFPLACADVYLASHFIDQLQQLKDKIFHWLDGKPVTYKTPRLKREVVDYRNYGSSSSHRILSSISFITFFLFSKYLFVV